MYQIEAGCIRLLWVGKERTTESFEKFFALIGTEIAAKVEFGRQCAVTKPEARETLA